MFGDANPSVIDAHETRDEIMRDKSKWELNRGALKYDIKFTST